MAIRPKDYTTISSSPGIVRATFSTCEIEGNRTIHLDCFIKDSNPYGHLSLKEAIRLQKFLEEAIPWLKDEGDFKGIPDSEWADIQKSLNGLLKKFT